MFWGVFVGLSVCLCVCDYCKTTEHTVMKRVGLNKRSDHILGKIQFIFWLQKFPKYLTVIL